tara:strand:+ start:83 stop:541 length:459 start_codon:yes stop_codon:yes gene_type:complete
VRKQLLTKTIEKLESIKQKNYCYILYSKNHTNSTTTTNQLVDAIFNIYLSNSNILINLTNLKGDTILKSSSGLVHYRGGEKTRKYALINIIKTIIDKSSNLNIKTAALHFKGLKRYRSLIVNLLKKRFSLTSVTHYYTLPHNGCRPRKQRRL